MTSRKKKVIARSIAVVAAISLVAVANVAFAHTHIAESNPTDGSSVEQAPETVTVRFGEPDLPPQPAQVSDASLEVFDACGTKVDKGDSTVDMQNSTVSVGAGGTPSGRYEIHWFATASDGAAQSGVIDFDVTTGTPCKTTKREDPKKDVDLGFDVLGLQSSAIKGGVKVRVTLADAVSCASFKDKDLTLSMLFDTNSDRTSDVEGRFTCQAGTFRLNITEGDDVVATLPVSHPSGAALDVKIKKHALLKDLDVSVAAAADKEECTDKVCVEVAPDLGQLNVM